MDVKLDLERVGGAALPAPGDARLEVALLLVEAIDVARALVELVGAVVVVAEDGDDAAQVFFGHLLAAHKLKDDALALLDGEVEVYGVLGFVGLDLAVGQSHPGVALGLVVVDEALKVLVEALGAGAAQPQAAVIEKVVQLRLRQQREALGLDGADLVAQTPKADA